MTHKAEDGTIRQDYYGSGRQPWDDIKELGWAPHFAAGNVLKYMRRASAKNGQEDIDKATWYARELGKLAQLGPNRSEAHMAIASLIHALTADEYEIISKVAIL